MNIVPKSPLVGSRLWSWLVAATPGRQFTISAMSMTRNGLNFTFAADANGVDEGGLLS